LRQCPLPLVDLHSTPQDIPREQIPSIIKTNALDADNKTNAYAAAARSYVRLEAPSVRDALRRIATVKQTDIIGRPQALLSPSRRHHMHAASAPIPSSPALTATRDLSQSPQERENEQHATGRSPTRIVVSAPPPARNQLHVPKSRLDIRVPGSPIGNAFSGEHYWAPISPQPVTPRAKKDESIPEGFLPHQPEPSTSAYDAVREAASAYIAEYVTKAEKRGVSLSIEDMPKLEVLAANHVFEAKNAQFAITLPIPHNVTAKIFALAEEESRAVSSWTIHDEAVLANSKIWLRGDGSCTTILDSAKNALDMIKRRKEFLLEIPEEAWELVHALQLLEEKEWKLVIGDEEMEEGSDHSSDEEELKSIAEVVRENKSGRSRQSLVATTFSPLRNPSAERRNVSLGLTYDQLEGKQAGEGSARRYGSLGRTVDAEGRRMKGKAPSALDLESWAEHLRRMEEGLGGGKD
jgi:hypothetical protein